MTSPQLLCRSVRALAAVAAASAAVAALTSCTSVAFAPQQPPGWPAAAQDAEVQPAADQPDPAPGSTVAAESLPPVGLPSGLTMAVVVPAAPGTDEVLRAVDALAVDLGATVRTVSAAPGSPVDPEVLLGSAVDEGADVVVVLGGEMLDALDRVSASTLDQQFLALGAQLPEPTANVTAVVWPGSVDALAPRAGEALAAGLTAVAQGTTGYVLALP